MRTPKIPTCHPDRKYYAKGLCRSCYQTKSTKERIIDPQSAAKLKEQKLLAIAKRKANRTLEQIEADRDYQRLFKQKQRQDPAFRKREREAQKRWLLKNPEYEKERAKRRWRTNPEPLKAATARYHSKNPGKRKEFKKKWQENNPEKHLLQMRSDVKRRKARKKGATICDLTKDQWEQLKKEYNYTCAYCGLVPDILTQDHCVPLSRGGNHTITNIVPACFPCNSKKGTRTQEEYKHVLATL